MYEELVERLRARAKRENDYYEHGGDIINEAADAIEDLAYQNAKWEKAVKTALDFIPCWVSVTERLPEEKRDGFSEDVLMLVENPDGDITWRDIYVGYYLYDSAEETGWWAMMTCDCVKIGTHKYGGKCFPANEYVTHWMPLPEPPKEET